MKERGQKREPLLGNKQFCVAKRKILIQSALFVAVFRELWCLTGAGLHGDLWDLSLEVNGDHEVNILLELGK